MMDEENRTKFLVEEIARSAYRENWYMHIKDIDVRSLFADENRIVIVDVSSYFDLEMMGEAAYLMGFTLDGKVINSNSYVEGQPRHVEWKVTRTWWFTLTDADKGDPTICPYATPKGVQVRFVYSETRKANAF